MGLAKQNSLYDLFEIPPGRIQLGLAVMWKYY